MKPGSRFAAILFSAMSLLAPSGFAATVYTGDTIEGKQVISQLDVDDLAPGQIHKFLFEGVEMGTGQHWYVPVMVAKGVKEGKRLLLVSGVHGDELNPIATVQKVFAELDPSKLAGAVIGVIGSSRPGVEHTTRGWLWMDLGHSQINPNRTWPGIENGNTVQRHSWLLMNRLIKGNVDIGVDIHTGGNGIAFGLFSFTDSKDKEALQLSKLFPLDQIYLHQGTGGSLAAALVAAGIPAFTLELGGPRSLDQDMIDAGVKGVENVFSYYKMQDRPMGQTAMDRNVFIGNELVDLFADNSGYTELFVKIDDMVTKGQKVAVQKNAFGEIIHEYIAPTDGRVAIIGTDYVRERGVDVVSILTNSDKCEDGGCEYNGHE
ncbi:MAG: succinylglutamate desuccinylase/aspartoacylase family protein [Halieaceae bacterium]|jgi:predicted deacylase|nr:succinylglutamate desuccinylase/aspartoacylase family protein [Halieaceae bacterium]